MNKNIINTVIHGDALQALSEIAPDSVDAIITDPPYSSGGLFRGDRTQSTGIKYLNNDSKAEYTKHDFEGDTRDQHSWMAWTAHWLTLGRAITKKGGVVAIFSDWRQLCALCDALQWAGWIWRGIAVWDKKASRPQPGRFRQQCEFVVWGSNGPLDIKRNAPFLPGLFSYSMTAAPKRLHQTEKPLTLMRELVNICEAGGVIVDPFAGSGSTLAAGVLEGFRVIGIEKDEYYAAVARGRLTETLQTASIPLELIRKEGVT